MTKPKDLKVGNGVYHKEHGIGIVNVIVEQMITVNFNGQFIGVYRTTLRKIPDKKEG